MNRPRRSGWTWACVCIWFLFCLLLGIHALAGADGPRAQWARWEAWAKQVQADHQRRLQQQATRNIEHNTERAYIAWVQDQCGDEAWFRPREGAAPVCTDKRGRATGQIYTGAQP